MNIAIVGHEAKKFTPLGERRARAIIRSILAPENVVDRNPTMVSGHCHLGGIDIWAEEEADALEIPKLVYPPARLDWAGGYRPRNVKIAEASAIVHVIVVTDYPPGYDDMRFKTCYHCHKTDHIKSGGCWTAKYAAQLGRNAAWWLVENL